MSTKKNKIKIRHGSDIHWCVRTWFQWFSWYSESHVCSSVVIFLQMLVHFVTHTYFGIHCPVHIVCCKPLGSSSFLRSTNICSRIVGVIQWATWATTFMPLNWMDYCFHSAIAISTCAHPTTAICFHWLLVWFMVRFNPMICQSMSVASMGIIGHWITDASLHWSFTSTLLQRIRWSWSLFESVCHRFIRGKSASCSSRDWEPMDGMEGLYLYLLGRSLGQTGILCLTLRVMLLCSSGRIGFAVVIGCAWIHIIDCQRLMYCNAVFDENNVMHLLRVCMWECLAHLL